MSGLLFGCAAPGPENTSGLGAKIVSVKNHGEGVDITLALKNTTNQTMRLARHGSVSVRLDNAALIAGQVTETVDIAPGESKTIKTRFQFINSPRIYKKGLVEIVPQKVFHTCRAADADPEVAREVDQDGGREPTEIQPETCDRPLKRAIRLAF